MLAGCLGERDRPGPPRLSLTIDEPFMSASRTDTVAGTVRAEDPDGLDSVWVAVDTVEKGEDAGFDRMFASRYRFIVEPGRGVGENVTVTVRARDILGFQVQRDTYIVVIP